MALKYLETQGLTFVEKNFRIKQGELDLIMMDSGTLVFIEVRYRKSSKYGSPEETVTFQKQKKLLQAATAYLQNRGLTDRYPCRFDVVAITPIAQKPSFSWYKDAFSAF
ncbi:MAG: YraN family protein [Pseudomonadales bacterium]|nr:YraN family protein [Pseudomonadales bacterium]